MSPPASGVLPEKPRASDHPHTPAHVRPVLEKQPKPATAPPELGYAPAAPPAKSVLPPPAPPGVKPAQPATSAHVMALQSTYGNAAMARSATSGEFSTTPKQPSPVTAAADATVLATHSPTEKISTPSSPASPVSAIVAAPATSVHPPLPPAPAAGAVVVTPSAASPAVVTAATPALATAVPTPVGAAASGPGAPGGAPVAAGSTSSPAASAAPAAAKGARAAAGPSKPLVEKVAGDAHEGKHKTGHTKGAAPAAHAPTAAKHARSAATDLAFQAVVHHTKSVAKHQSAHAPAASKAAAAHGAAAGAPNEVSSLAAAKQTSTMDQQKPKAFDRASFKNALLKKIKETAPKTLKDADEFKKNNKLAGMKSEMSSQVSQEKKDSQGAIAEKTAEKPDTSGIEPKPVTPLPPPETGNAAEIPAAGAAPKPANDADISLQAGPNELNQQMADANVTEAQLQQSNEPTFQSAVTNKKEAEKESTQAPQDFRKQEVVMLGNAQGEAQSAATKHAHDMHHARALAHSAVAGHQVDAKAEEEKTRVKISADIQAIYDRTKKDIETRLQTLDKEVNDTFDAGATAAQKDFEDHVSDRMFYYKLKRYLGPAGLILWGKDQFMDLPHEVDVFYTEGHDLYVNKMDAVIDHVAALVESGLNEAKGIIARGKAEIDTYLQKLPAEQKEIGKKAVSGIQGKFDALEQSISAKQDQLIDSLAKKYNDNLQKVDERIAQMKEENRGLVHKAGEALKGVIQTIIDLKNMLLNVLSRAVAAIGMIIDKPIAFLGHLVDAGKLGFSQFADHIVEHLKQGFMEWLFGAVAQAGIQLPKNFDLPGILSLVLQILGLTYSNIRSRAVKILGEKVVKALETAAEIFKILITKGPAGLWEYIKEKIGDLKAMVIEKIKSFVMEKIVIAGITWLIGLLNPASAFVKACKAIYDIVMFFVERGKQILDLVNTIIDSIVAIAKGMIGAAANWVEKSLARTIPVIIGFLASLLGIGGISEKIKEIIEAIRKPINEAIDWVINKAVDLVKAIGGMLGFGKKDEKTPASNDPEHDAKVKAGLAAVDEEDLKREKEGKITREDAEEVAVNVKKNHPVFKNITVVEGEETWDYDYTASPGERKAGPPKQAKPGDSEKNAIDFPWVKPAVANYHSIQLAPADEVAEARKKLGKHDLSPADVGKLPGAFTASSTATTALDGATVGVTNPMSQTRQGFVFQAGEKQTDNSEKNKVNRVLEKHGYNRKDNKDPTTDGDHVMEKQLGGPDSEDNVWPLNSSVNQSSGSKVRSQIEDVKSKNNFKTIVGKFFKLKL
jgi:hypothetical protein